MVETVAKRNTITTNTTLSQAPPDVKTSDENSSPNGGISDPNPDNDTLLSPRTNRNLLAEALESVQIAIDVTKKQRTPCGVRYFYGYKL
jgi:hypothetical protein